MKLHEALAAFLKNEAKPSQRSLRTKLMILMCLPRKLLKMNSLQMLTLMLTRICLMTNKQHQHPLTLNPTRA